MAYDKEKAHEYYIKYRKKGIKKGRKKGKRKTTKPKQVGLLGISTAGLNDAGKMQAALIKDKLKTEMNEALQKETDPAKKEVIRQEYQNKALSEVSALKANSEYAKPKAEKKAKEKTSSGKSTKSSSSSQSSNKERTQRINSIVETFNEKMSRMTDEQKQQVKDMISRIIEMLRSRK